MGNGCHVCTPVLMDMSNITFEVTRLSTFVFKKCSEKITSRLNILIRALSGVSGAGMESVTRIITCMKQSETWYNHPVLFQCQASVEYCGSTLKQRWVNATCLHKAYTRPSDELVLGQRRRCLASIEPAMDCDAGPTSNRFLVGRPTS